MAQEQGRRVLSEAEPIGKRLFERLMGRPREANETVPAAPHGDELQELAETFHQTVDRLASLMQEVEEAHQKALQAEIERKQFYRDVLRAVTQGKFELVDADEIPEPGQLAAELWVGDGREYAAARQALLDAARAIEMTEDRAGDLLLAAGEAITNAMKHASRGRCLIYRAPDLLSLRVVDEGAGIRSHDLPAAILTPGFSTQVSLGMGYTMMLKLCDRVWLSTGPEGTVIQLEKRVQPPAPTPHPWLVPPRREQPAAL